MFVRRASARIGKSENIEPTDLPAALDPIEYLDEARAAIPRGPGCAGAKPKTDADIAEDFSLGGRGHRP
jgi:hypothetical protein